MAIGGDKLWIQQAFLSLSKDHWFVGVRPGCSDVRVTIQGGHKRGLVGPRQRRTPERDEPSLMREFVLVHTPLWCKCCLARFVMLWCPRGRNVLKVGTTRLLGGYYLPVAQRLYHHMLCSRTRLSMCDAIAPTL